MRRFVRIDVPCVNRCRKRRWDSLTRSCGTVRPAFQLKSFRRFPRVRMDTRSSRSGMGKSIGAADVVQIAAGGNCGGGGEVVGCRRVCCGLRFPELPPARRGRSLPPIVGTGLRPSAPGPQRGLRPRGMELSPSAEPCELLGIRTSAQIFSAGSTNLLAGRAYGKPDTGVCADFGIFSHIIRRQYRRMWRLIGRFEAPERFPLSAACEDRGHAHICAGDRELFLRGPVGWIISRRSSKGVWRCGGRSARRRARAWRRPLRRARPRKVPSTRPRRTGRLQLRCG